MKVMGAKDLGNHILRITFSNGTEREVSIGDFI